MTFNLILILNIVLDVTLLGGLAYVMSRAGKLAEHVPQAPIAVAASPATVAHRRARATGHRVRTHLQTALD
ncbi:MAG TPA: hypothetical protein VHW67_08745 [Solirubrobacteraceae bacterium]|jgi:hypothetical protein|nr:hypothetical protein [Solirubrobacteraceae bacterium]